MQVGFLPGKWTIIVLYTKIDVVHNMDIQCDKLATDDRRQFKLTALATVDVQLRNCLNPKFGTKFQ